MSLADPTESQDAKKDSSAASLSRIPVKRFGDYNLIGRLGFGGMAEVFLAFTAGPGGVRKLCVVKRLHKHLRESKEFVRMFLDEARLAAQLNHPNIVSTYELGEIDGAYFIAMEYLQGQSFDRLLRLKNTGDPMIWNQIVAQVLVDACDGMHYAHEFRDFDDRHYNIIHRDISPQNIFVSYDGIAKILDFGVAKAVTQMDATESGVLKGKCSYVAPEQAYGEKIDRRVDVWAMGVVLWEGLAGRRLFKAETNAATLLEVLTAEIPLVMDLSSHISLSLGQIVEKALQRDPRKRYRTAEEMKRDLELFLREVPAPISRKQVGDFLTAAFDGVIRKQQRVVEECLADALASRMPREKKRGPDLQSLSGSSSRGIKLSSIGVGAARSDTVKEPAVEFLVKRRSERVGRVSPAASPTPTPSSMPQLPMSTSEPSYPLLDPSQPNKARRQNFLFGVLALVLAVLAAVAVAIIYQQVMTGRRQGALFEERPRQRVVVFDYSRPQVTSVDSETVWACWPRTTPVAIPPATTPAASTPRTAQSQARDRGGLSSTPPPPPVEV